MANDDGQRGQLAGVPDRSSDALWHRSFPWQRPARATEPSSDVDPFEHPSLGSEVGAPPLGLGVASPPMNRHHVDDEPWPDIDAHDDDENQADDDRVTTSSGVVGARGAWPDLDAYDDDELEADHGGMASTDVIGAPRAWMGSVHRRPKAFAGGPAKVALGMATAVALVVSVLVLRAADHPQASGAPVAAPPPPLASGEVDFSSSAPPTESLAPTRGGAAAPSPLPPADTQSAQPPATGTAGFELSGKVSCRSGRPVQGLWVQANKDSGYAKVKATGNGSTAQYAYTLPAAEPYAVHVGCGGSPAAWATTAYSPTVSGTSKSFDCIDTVNLVYGKCLVL